MKPGRALDLACGFGKNALWLTELGWRVTAVDNSAAAIESLQGRVAEARVADLEKGEFRIQPASWDLIVIAYYLQRDLFEPARRGLIPGGMLIAITLLGETHERFRLQPGELARYFEGDEILHSHEGAPTGETHHKLVSEIVARRMLECRSRLGRSSNC